MERFLSLATRIIATNATGYLTCIRIWRGHVMITNTRVSYTSFFPELEHIDATIEAKKFLAAMRGAKFKPDAIRQTDKSIIVSKGSFKARTGLLENTHYPAFGVRGEEAILGIDTFAILKRIRPFVSTDASRAWACAVLFDGTHVWATNNASLVRQPLRTPRSFVLPVAAFDELLRADCDVSRVAVSDNGMRFDMTDGISLHTKLLSYEWPDVAAMIPSNQNPPEVPKGLREGVTALVPLCENMSVPKIIFNEYGMHTEEGVTQAKFEGIAFPPSTFNAKPLLDVLAVATHLDLSTYPRPCYFKGPNGLEGVTMGMRA